MGEKVALFFHVLGAFIFIGGVVTVSMARFSAIFLLKPADIATVLGSARPIVHVVAFGLLLTIAAGFGVVAEEHGLGYDANFLIATYVLVGWMLIAGAIAGRLDRHTRELAEEQKEKDTIMTDALKERLRDPVSFALNMSMLLSIVAVVGLMIWKPH